MTGCLLLGELQRAAALQRRHHGRRVSCPCQQRSRMTQRGHQHVEHKALEARDPTTAAGRPARVPPPPSRHPPGGWLCKDATARISRATIASSLPSSKRMPAQPRSRSKQNWLGRCTSGSRTRACVCSSGSGYTPPKCSRASTARQAACSPPSASDRHSRISGL